MNAEVTILTSDKLDFRTRNIIRDKEEHLKMKTWFIHQEDIRIINVYTPYHRNSKYTKKKLTDRREKQEILQLKFQISILLS